MERFTSIYKQLTYAMKNANLNDYFPWNSLFDKTKFIDSTTPSEVIFVAFLLSSEWITKFHNTFQMVHSIFLCCSWHLIWESGSVRTTENLSNLQYHSSEFTQMAFNMLFADLPFLTQLYVRAFIQNNYHLLNFVSVLVVLDMR